MIFLEMIAVLFGIISVVYAKKENILVYPTGIICTVITVYILYKAEYFGDMMMNIYYSSMSIYGWWNWTRYKDDNTRIIITYTNYMIVKAFPGELMPVATATRKAEVKVNHLPILAKARSVGPVVMKAIITREVFRTVSMSSSPSTS